MRRASLSQQNGLRSARATHLVGTIPANSTAEAMALAQEHLGDSLRWLPDGETGARNNWVMPIVEALRSHPDLAIKRDGDWSEYDKTPSFKVRKGHRLRVDSLSFGHVAWFQESLPEFRAVKQRLGQPDLAFQIGIPGPFDMAGIVLGPQGALLHRRPFHDATVAEIAGIFALAGEEVVFQIEVPFELVFVARAPSELRGLVAKWLGRIVAKVARDAPDGARFGVHLCLGDMEHKALIEMSDVGPVVALANAIVAAWPQGRPLEFMHAPFSGASQPPPTDPAFYEPLRNLQLPGSTRFVAGFVSEHQSLQEQQRVLEMIERAYGLRVDVSAACGMGRRSLQEAIASFQQAKQLAGS
jgi:hypothetical protein